MKFIPYAKQTIDEEDINGVVNALKSNFLTTGSKIKQFEDIISNYTKAKYCVAVSSATAALHLASLVLLNENDKVLTTPNSFLATSNSILYAKAKPIFVDICEDGNINLDLCEEYLKKDISIKAIYAVHFSGKSVNQEKLKNLKNRYKIKILEDCAHSLGASFGTIKTGSCKNSDCSIFSFHPAKHITTAEGGAITTNSQEIYEKLLSLRSHGVVKTSSMKPWEYEMRNLGFNYRITDIQCALGISQFKKINIFLDKRKKIAKKYDKAFEKRSNINPLYPFTDNSSYHLYVLRVDFRKLTISKEELFIKMREKNIALQVHYIPINKQVFYKNLGYINEKNPVMDKYYEQCLSLPMYPSLKHEEQNYIIVELLKTLGMK